MIDYTSRIFVAGHTGLVGQAFVRRLKKDGYINLILRGHSELDLTNQQDVIHFFSQEKPDIVIICAGKVGGIYANSTFPAEFIYDNLQIQTNLIHQSYLGGVKKLVYFCSTCAYPKYADQPMVEKSLLTGSLEPTNEPYAVAKIAGLKMCQSYNCQYGTHYLTIVPTNLYGPYDNFDTQNGHVIPGMIRRLHHAKENHLPEVSVWGSGTPKREFLFVDDLVDACLFILQNNYFENQPVHIGSQLEISIKELASLISQTVGYFGKLSFDTSKPDGMPLKKVDTSKLDNLGWRASTNLASGLGLTYEWFLNNRGVLL